ncbi:MAG TPA: PA14 domain-containing protein, partial [Chryseosolibacter sp.]|nr:PA14 domain-containing protein [Chryseosolibacter sp.]
NDAAPITVNAPANFAGISTSPSENALSWTDASTNETGFEIWRRRKTNGTTFSPWEMAGIVPANTKTFDDTGVEPTVSYQYKIRAVSNTARSNYTPSPVNEGLVIQTVIDKEPPKAPVELKAEAIGVQKIRLTWKPSTDNTRIREYFVYFNNDSVSTASSDTTFLLTAISPNIHYDISVKGVDLSRNFSPPSNVQKVSTYFSGLYYEHTTGSWTDLDSVDWDFAEMRGKVGFFTLSPKTQDDYYNFSFDGYLFIEKAGSYQLRIGSSDGSRLWLDNQLLADNDGLHDFKTVESAATTLQRGPHRIYVQYFEHTGVDSLAVQYKGPDTGGGWVTISREELKSDENVVTGVGDPDNGPEDSFKVSIYPNPTTQDNINIVVETVIPAPVRIQLLDPMGRNLFEGDFEPGGISGRGVRISPPGVMNTGMYVVVVTQANVRVREKVVIKRQ